MTLRNRQVHSDVHASKPPCKSCRVEADTPMAPSREGRPWERELPSSFGTAQEEEREPNVTFQFLGARHLAWGFYRERPMRSPQPSLRWVFPVAVGRWAFVLRGFPSSWSLGLQPVSRSSNPRCSWSFSAFSPGEHLVGWGTRLRTDWSSSRMRSGKTQLRDCVLLTVPTVALLDVPWTSASCCHCLSFSGF